MIIINHLVFGCPIQTLIEYKERHKIANYIYWKVCKYHGKLDREKWYKHQSEPITEAKRVTIFWYFAIQNRKKNKEPWIRYCG